MRIFRQIDDKLSMFESVAVDPYSHHGLQLTMVGRQRVSAKNLRIGVMRP